MGCNSHISIEVKEKWWDSEPSRWTGYAIGVPESRNYSMYEIMAGVRGIENKAFVEPRGVPADASEYVKNWTARWEGDGHTHSWLSAKEYNEVLKIYNKTYFDFDYRLDNNWIALGKVLTALAKVYEDARVVFFFDN